MSLLFDFGRETMLGHRVEDAFKMPKDDLLIFITIQAENYFRPESFQENLLNV